MPLRNGLFQGPTIFLLAGATLCGAAAAGSVPALDQKIENSMHERLQASVVCHGQQVCGDHISVHVNEVFPKEFKLINIGPCKMFSDMNHMPCSLVWSTLKSKM